MTSHLLPTLLAGTCSVFLLAASSFAQCGTPDTRFHAPGIGSPGVVDAIVFDSGSGPELYVAGSFSAAGGVAAKNVARWDGTQWSAVGGGTDGPVYALATAGAGSGAKLYAAGPFTAAGGISALRIASWDGTAWAPLGTGIGGIPTGDVVYTLCVFDSGSGPELYVGGIISSAGGIAAHHIARWSIASQAWVPMTGISTGTTVEGMVVFDDGGGPKLYVGGFFNLERWDGTSWSTFAPFPQGAVHSLGVNDDGSGSKLYVGGRLDLANGGFGELESWNGSSWNTISAIGGAATVSAVQGYDDGSGSALYVAGVFNHDTELGAGAIRRWDGASLSDLPALSPASSDGNNTPQCLCVFDEGAGPALFAGGSFGAAGGIQASRIARWKSGAWSALGAGHGLSGECKALLRGDLGAGPRLFAGGDFGSAGPPDTSAIASWNGSQWSALGQGITGVVQALALYDDGSGPSLVAAGPFTAAGGQPLKNIAHWNGSGWSGFGPGLSQAPQCVLSFDDGSGPALFAGGYFTSTPSLPATAVAKWNGSSWSAIAAPPAQFGSPMQFVAFDDGGGPRLFAAGRFPVSTHHDAVLQKWSGSSWTKIGISAESSPQALAALVADLGSGLRLYVGGEFTDLDGSGISYIGTWNGTSWSPLGSGLDGAVQNMIVHDDGTGPALYVSGNFAHAGGIASPLFARWDGSSWSAATFTPELIPEAMASFDDGSGGGADLYFGGWFGALAGVPSAYFGELVTCGQAISPFCYGDGGALACPCANNGAAGHGCESSAHLGGALLAGSGSTQPDNVVVTTNGLPPSALTVLLQGSTNLWPGVHFGDGLRCVGGVLKRLFTKAAVGGVVVVPGPGDPSISARSAALGYPIFPGSVLYYQLRYRDPNPNFCPAPQGNTWNASNGAVIRW